MNERRTGAALRSCVILLAGMATASVLLTVLCSGIGGGDRPAAPVAQNPAAPPPPPPAEPAKPKGPEDVDQVAVLNQGRDAVRRFLKDPATADFSTWDTTTDWFESAGTWVTTGTVTYSTAFGRPESSYRVVLDYSEWPEKVSIERVVLGGEIVYQRPLPTEE